MSSPSFEPERIDHRRGQPNGQTIARLRNVHLILPQGYTFDSVYLSRLDVKGCYTRGQRRLTYPIALTFVVTPRFHEARPERSQGVQPRLTQRPSERHFIQPAGYSTGVTTIDA